MLCKYLCLQCLRNVSIFLIVFKREMYDSTNTLYYNVLTFVTSTIICIGYQHKKNTFLYMHIKKALSYHFLQTFDMGCYLNQNDNNNSDG